MLHHFSSQNMWLERPTTPDGSNDTDAPKRPPAGTTVYARNAADGSKLSPSTFTTNPGGLWDYAVDYDGDTLQIVVSVDSGFPADSTSKSIPSFESITNALQSASTANAAMSAASSAQQTAQQALDNAQASGVKKVANIAPDVDGNVDLTATDVGARPADVDVPAADVSGLGKTATSNLYTDLDSRPPAAIPATDKGEPGGVPTLDSDGMIKSQFLPVTQGTVTGINDLTPDSDGKIDLTAADVGARASDVDVPADDVSGLADVATSGSYTDLDDTPTIPSTPDAVGAQPALGFNVYVQQDQPSGAPVNSLWFSDSDGGGGGTVGLSQVGAGTNDTFGTTLTLSPTQKLTSGSRVLVAVSCVSDTTTVTVADSASSTYTADVNTSYATSPKVHVYLFSATLSADLDTTDTITVTGSSSGDILSAVVLLAAGVGTTGSTATGSGSNHTYVVDSPVTPSSGDLVVAVIASNYPSLQTDFLAGAGYTALAGIGPNTNQNNRTIAVQYLVSTGTETAGNASGANDHSWAEALAVYEAS